MTKQREVVYEPHPVSIERKRELLASGYKILDARFDPARQEEAADVGEGSKGGSKPADGDDLNSARARYLEVVGKRPFNGWDLETLNAKIAEATPSEETAANGLTRREIAADLEAMQVEFDPNDGIEDLSALRELAREERDR